MQIGSPSSTALTVATLRALHQTMDHPTIFRDPLAARILGAAGPSLLAAQRTSADDTVRLRTTLAARSVIAEETMSEATARGVRQGVILGAGLDTFAYRHGHAGLRIFEVDHPATQTWKRGLLHGAGIDVAPSVRYAAVDFARDDLFDALTAAGFDRAQPAVFTMLGVTPYLVRDLVLDLLNRIGRECGGDVEVVFDYTEPFHDAPATIRLPYEAAATRVAAVGEPWVTLFDPAVLRAALRARNFSDIRDVDAAGLHERFCAARTDGLAVAPLVHLVRARVRHGSDCIPGAG